MPGGFETTMTAERYLLIFKYCIGQGKYLKTFF